jgi:putative ABC transport system permease protein
MSVFDWLPWMRERRTRELAAEMQTHLELAAADRVTRGESPAEAAANARREFGNVGLIQEVSRDEWGSGSMWLERLGQDTRFAVRVLRRSPGFTTTAVLTMALGIGAATAIFSVVDATLLHPLPYPHAEQLVRVEDDLVGLGARDVGMSTPEWRDLQRAGVFEHVSPAWYDDNNLTGLARAQRVSLSIVAPNYFSLLEVKPQLGVLFDPTDATPGFNEQAIISDGLWKRAFSANPDVLGKIVQLDSDSYRIVGVMPPGFQAPASTPSERGTEVWVAFGFAGAPLSPRSVVSRSPLFPGALARLKRGVTLEEAQHRVDALVQSLRRQYSGDYPPRSDWRVRLVPLQEHIVGAVRQPLLVLLGAVGLVLLIGCANVANLLLARATTRSRELAVRQAIGAAPSRITRQLLTESVLLSLVGGVVGIALLVAVKGSLVRVVPLNVPRLNDITISWPVLALAFAASMLAGVIFGLAPAFDIRRLDVTRVLKQEGRGSAGGAEQKRARRTLVVSEFALSLVLLSAAGLLVRSFWRMLNTPLGFDPRNVTVIHTRLPYPNDPKEDLYSTVSDEARFVRAVIQRIKALPGVDGVALGSGAAVPLDHPQQDQNVMRVLFERGATQTTQPVFVNGSEVTPEYFGLLGITPVRGRLFDSLDIDGHPSVAVIDEAMARTYWPGEDPIGKRLKFSPRDTMWTSIVGIVHDARTESLSEASIPHLYASLYQREGKHLAIFVRGHVAVASLARDVRTQVQAVNAALPVFGEETLDNAVSASLAMRRFSMNVIACFAAVAVLLAALGMYGVISYMVSERTHEFGVRLALGAQREDVMVMVLRQGFGLVMMGGSIGLIAALVVARSISGMLVGVSPNDPVTFAAATLVLAAVAAAGCLIPARRAVRVDPIVALRY